MFAYCVSAGKQAAKLSESMKAQAVPSDIGEKPAAAPSQDYASAGEPQKAPSSSELNEAGKMGKETSQGTATTQLSEHQELAQKVAKLNNASSDTPATYDEVMEVRRQILEHTRQAYRDVAPMTKQLQVHDNPLALVSCILRLTMLFGTFYGVNYTWSQSIGSA